MKLLSLLFLSIFFAKGCDEQTNKEMKDTVVEYSANSRGYYRKIIVQNQMVSVATDRNGAEKAEKVKISDADWKLLVDEFSKVNLDQLDKLKAPTEKRFYDGAAIAHLTVTSKGKTYQSTDFDHGFPPKEIEALVKRIVAFDSSK